MKKLPLLLAFVSVSVLSFAQSEKYFSAMKKNLGQMDSSFISPAALINLANSFERIANTEKSQWLPYYYAAFCQVNAGFMEKDKSKVDGIADKAALLAKAADSLSPNNSEISCIKSMIASCHMMVNPMQRWQQYGIESSNNMEAAMMQDTTNPRPYFLKGQTLRYTPEQFGGGCEKAKPQFEIALEKYKNFKPASELHPSWGKGLVEQMLKSCD